MHVNVRPYAAALGLTGLALACGPGQIATDAGEDDSEGSDTQPPTCEHAPAAVEFELFGPTPQSLIVLPVTVVGAEQDATDPGRWTFGFQTVEDNIDIGIEFRSEPPLEFAPFALDESLTIAYASLFEDGASLSLVEIYDASEVSMSLIHTHGPAPLSNVGSVLHPWLDFQWTQASNCSFDEMMCGSVDVLHLDILRFPDEFVTQLGPGQRHTKFEVTINDEDHAYELWLGETWTSECGGSPTESIRYALFRQPA